MSDRASIIIAWNPRARAYVARDPARRAELARGATLAETARKLAEATDPRERLLDLFRRTDARAKRLGFKPPTMKEIDAEIRRVRSASPRKA